VSAINTDQPITREQVVRCVSPTRNDRSGQGEYIVNGQRRTLVRSTVITK